MNIFTTKHSRESALALSEALNNCAVYNPYERKFYRGDTLDGPSYNMGCSGIRGGEQVAVCVDKIKTFDMLNAAGVLTAPYTSNYNTAQEWLASDRIIVNRTTIIGKANEGLSYSYKGLPDVQDKGLDSNAIIWTRYVNHTRELRTYVFKGQSPLIFEKVDVGGGWFFKKIRPSEKLLSQVKKAQDAFNGLLCSGYDILECVTGDYYFLENNSAPSLLVHKDIIPTLVRTIKNEYSV